MGQHEQECNRNHLGSARAMEKEAALELDRHRGKDKIPRQVCDPLFQQNPLSCINETRLCWCVRM